MENAAVSVYILFVGSVWFILTAFPNCVTAVLVEHSPKPPCAYLEMQHQIFPTLSLKAECFLLVCPLLLLWDFVVALSVASGMLRFAHLMYKLTWSPL